MTINIYQIEFTRDRYCVAFGSWDMMMKRQGSIDPEIYYQAYHGTVEAKDLEDVYYIFNMDWPEDFTGHSLSVSDVVEVIIADEVEPGFYYCDDIGFKKIDFKK